MNNLAKTLSFSLLVISLITSNSSVANDHRIIGKHIFGLMVDVDNDPLIRNQRAEIHNQASSSAEVAYDKASFSASVFNQPVGAVYLTKLDQDSGKEIKTQPVDASGINGISAPVGGLPTEWGSLIYSESALVDAADPKSFVDKFKPYYKGDSKKVNPYEYGWPIELVVLNMNGESKLIKNYAMGRVAAENLLVMPDNKTVWMLSGEKAGYLYVFIAEDSGNFSKGQLLVANSDDHSVNFVPVANTSTLKAKFQLRRIKFDSLFQSGEFDGGVCDNGIQPVNTVYGIECLKVKNKRYSGLFEPHRFAALAGVKPQFNAVTKMTYKPDTNTLVLEKKSGDTIGFNLGSVGQFSSDYLIKERL